MVPAIVQGQEGIASICQSLEVLYQRDMDVIIVGRGGGSLEELWCFNEEAVVRKIAASPVPIISAVGHETDVTLADFAADVRAATPSMAAELAVPEKNQLEEVLSLRQRTLEQRFSSLLLHKKQYLAHLASHRLLQKPELLLQDRQQLLDETADKLEKAIQLNLAQKKQEFAVRVEKLNALSPLHVLGRGYALCQKENGQVIRSASDAAVGERVQIVLEKGCLTASVLDREE